MSEGSDEWRLKVVRTFVPAVGGALALVPFYFLLEGGLALAKPFWMVGLTGLLLVAGATCSRRASWPITFLLAAMILAVTLERASVLGWPPGVVAAIVSLEVFVGLLLGRAAPYVLIVVVAGALAALGVYTNRAPRPDFPAALALTRWENWLRVGLVLVTITGAAGFGLYRIGRWLERTEGRLSATVENLNQQLEYLAAARSRRRDREQALREAQKLQSVAQLGRGFAHAFNNALTVIRSALEEARGARSAAETASLVAIVRSSVQALAQRSRDLLMLARPAGDAGGAAPLAATLAALEPVLRSRLRDNIQLRLEVQGDARVGVPARWLEQLLLNLLLNAEQAMPLGGTVTIAAQIECLAHQHHAAYDVLPAGNYAVLRVRDDGPGMTSEVAARAFEPFFTTRGREHHDGLGLTLVHNMARQIGGAVEVERPDLGASVAIYLPVNPGHASAREQPTEPARPAVSPWKAEALRGIARVGAVSVALAVTAGQVHVYLVDSQVRSHLIIGLPLLALMAWVGFGKRAGYDVRLAGFLGGALLAGLLLVGANGFMQAAPVGLLCLLVLLSWMLGSPRLGLVAGAVIVVGFALAGFFHATGRVTVDSRPYSLAYPDNWLRIAINLSVMSLMSAEAVLHVLRAERNRVSALTITEAELKRARDRAQHEADAATDLQGMAARAARIESLGRLTGMTAHDLNNSLLALGGWAELLASADGRLSEAERLQYLSEMDRATDHAEALVSRLEQGGGVPTVSSSIDVAAAVRRAEGMLRALLRGEQRLLLDLSGDGAMLIDESCFRRVLLNLVANARDAMPAGGTCTIKTLRAGPGVQVHVEDDGAGIDEATRSRLFEAFFTTKGEKGTGLGLHSVAAIVSAVGGTIQVHSTLGHGTRFVLELPHTPLALPELVARPAGGARNVRGTVLLAEDEPTLRALLTSRLERAGYGVEQAADADQAMSRIQASGQLDALCTDAVMPGASVSEVLRVFVAKFPARPVLVMSGYLPDDLDTTLLARPRVVFLHKPFAGSRLIEVLGELLSMSQPAARMGS